MAERSGPEPSKGQAQGALTVVFAALAVSLSLVLSPLVFQAGMAPIALIALRSAAFAVLLLLIAKLTRRSLRLPPAQRRLALAIGLVYVMGAGGYLWSVFYLPVTLAVLIFYIYPILTLFIASLLDRRMPRLIELALLLAAFLGLALALGVSFERLDWRGVALVSGGALGIASSFVWMSRTLGQEDTMAVTFHMALSGAALAFLATLATGALSYPGAEGLAWLALAAVVISFAAGFLCMFRGVSLIGPVRAATIMNLEPVATIGLAALILGERMTALQLVGASVVILAVAFSQRR